MLRFVVGDHKLIEFQAVMLDQDPPYKAEAIDLNDYDDAKLFIKQIGPRPEDPTLFTPKEFSITGSFITPITQGYIGFDFTPTDLDTAGEYLCTLKLYNGASETWSSAHNFEMYVRSF